MKPKLYLTMILIILSQCPSAFGQTLRIKDSSLCLNAKNSKTTQCLNLKKSPIAIEYINGAFRMFAVPGKPVGTPPKDIFMSKKNSLVPVKSTISLKNNLFVLSNPDRKVFFELAFLPGTRGVFQFDRSGNIAFYSEDCLELEPIEVRDGEILYDGSDGARSIFFTLVDRDDILTKLICKEGVGISCIEDNIIDPQFFSLDLDLEDAFGTGFPVDYPAGGLTLPEGGGRWSAATNDGPICKECEEMTETQWVQVCEIDLRKMGLYKDCDGHLLVVDLQSGALCMDVDLGATALKVESVGGDMVRLSLPISEISGEQGCCPEQ